MKINNMVGPSIYGNELINFQVSRYLDSLPLWRRALAMLPIQRFKVTQDEFEVWFYEKQ